MLLLHKVRTRAKMICEAVCLFRLKYHIENYLASCSQAKRLMICLRIECFALYKMVIFTLKKDLLLLILLMIVIQSYQQYSREL